MTWNQLIAYHNLPSLHLQAPLPKLIENLEVVGLESWLAETLVLPRVVRHIQHCDLGFVLLVEVVDEGSEFAVVAAVIMPVTWLFARFWLPARLSCSPSRTSAPFRCRPQFGGYPWTWGAACGRSWRVLCSFQSSWRWIYRVPSPTRT